MRIEYLEYLLEVNRSGSISAAAGKLYLSQSTLSNIIVTLEESLDVKIFQRTRRGVRPTPDGELVLTYAQEIVAKNDELHKRLESKMSVRRLLNLILYPSACSYLSAPLSRFVGKRFPDLSLMIYESSYSKILSKLMDGMAKLAVCAESNDFLTPYQAQSNGYAFEPLYEDHFYLVVSKDSPYASRKWVAVDELHEEFLAFAHFYPNASDMTVGHVLKKFRRFCILNSNEVIKQSVLRNNMIALMPGLALYGDLYTELGLLRRIPVTGFDTKLVNFALFDSAASLDEAEQALLAEIRRLYAALPETLL